MRTTSASYRNSSAVFALASRGIAVSPHLLMSVSLKHHVHPFRRRIVSAPVSCFSADA